MRFHRVRAGVATAIVAATLGAGVAGCEPGGSDSATPSGGASASDDGQVVVPSGSPDPLSVDILGGNCRDGGSLSVKVYAQPHVTLYKLEVWRSGSLVRSIQDVESDASGVFTFSCKGLPKAANYRLVVVLIHTQAKGEDHFDVLR